MYLPKVQRTRVWPFVIGALQYKIRLPVTPLDEPGTDDAAK